MPRPASHRVFLQESLRRFQTTGAVLPSGRFLASALTRYVREGSQRPRRILEVGPGTGAVTRQIVRTICRDDRLDLVEINPSFVEVLHGRMHDDPDFPRPRTEFASCAGPSRTCNRTGPTTSSCRACRSTTFPRTPSTASWPPSSGWPNRRKPLVLRVHRHSQGEDARGAARRTAAFGSGGPRAERLPLARPSAKECG